MTMLGKILIALCFILFLFLIYFLFLLISFIKEKSQTDRKIMDQMDRLIALIENKDRY